MKKSFLIIFILFFTIGFVGCAPQQKPTVWKDVKSVFVQVESDNEIIVETYNVYLTNRHGDDSILVLASDNGSGIYNKKQTLTTANEFEHLVECDVGKVHIQFELYLKVKYNGDLLPYKISFSEDYYTKLGDRYINLFTDEKCEVPANFNVEVKDVKYSTGHIYNDNYKINLEIEY